MTNPMFQPVFPPTLRFVDIDPAERAHEEVRPVLPRPGHQPAGAWSEYLSRTLPPVRPDRPCDAGAPAMLRTRVGMADFLVSLGPRPARAVARNLILVDRSGFWRDVQREIEALAPGE